MKCKKNDVLKTKVLYDFQNPSKKALQTYKIEIKQLFSITNKNLYEGKSQILVIIMIFLLINLNAKSSIFTKTFGEIFNRNIY